MEFGAGVDADKAAGAGEGTVAWACAAAGRRWGGTSTRSGLSSA
jgi:hypothetical protein